MKRIPLKTIEVKLDGKPTRISYRAQLIEILRLPSDPRGSDYEEVRRSLRVLDALAQEQPADAPTIDGAPFLELEDADFEYMKQRVLHARWPFIDKFVMEFIEDVTSA
jgi:hypothetical protein